MLPAILAVVGSVLPGIVSSLVGAKTPEEARKSVQPQYEAMVGQLIGRGISRKEAEAQAEEAIQGAVSEKAQEGALPVWAEALLGVAGGIGGWMAGAKIAAKAGTKALAKTGAKEAAKDAAPVALLKAPKAPVKRDELMPPFGPKPKPGNTPIDDMADDAIEDVGAPLARRPEPMTRSGTMVPPDGGTMKMTPDEVAFYMRKERGRGVPERPVRADDPEAFTSQGLHLPFAGAQKRAPSGGDALEDAMYDIWEAQNR